MSHYPMFSFLAPPPPAEPLPEEQIPSTYRRYRWQVFIGIFIGYATYYLLRKNFSMAGPYLKGLSFEEKDIGFAMAGFPLAYGLSKFVMGTISDRSNARNFFSLGLVVTAILTILAGLFTNPVWFGEGKIFTNYSILFVWFGIQFLVGWFSASGWPPCGRVITHWFSPRERGRTIAVWNVAHNVGGGLLAPLTVFGVWIFTAKYWEWGVFYLPAILALGIAVITWFLVRDTPQSCGLPPIEVFHNDYPPEYSEKNEQELTTYQIVFQYILNNKIIWFVGIANAFVYLLRYGISDWAPTYLETVKGYNKESFGWAYCLYEYAAIPGTLLCGWLSDTVFRGRHALTSIVFMALTIPFLLLYWLNPLDAKWLDLIALCMLGFLVYGPVMLVGVLALQIVPKKAAGTSAGFMSFWGYFVGTAFLANILMGQLVSWFGWDSGFVFLGVGCLLSMVFLGIAAMSEKDLQTE